MLYEAIREGCKIYHWYYAKYDTHYNCFFEKKNQELWDNPKILQGEALNAEISKIISFLNVWHPRRPMDPSALATKLPQVLTDLNSLSKRKQTILDVELSERTTEVISKSFGSLASCGKKRKGKRQYESVAAAKILHLARPQVFIMWDNPIMDWYKRRNWYKLAYYARGTNSFLSKTQEFTKDVIVQVKEQGKASSDEEALRLFTNSCIHKYNFVKIVDEYNFVIARFKTRNLLIDRLSEKFNVSRAEVWRELFS